MSDDTYLIRAAEIAKMPGLQKTHFLNPEGRRTNLSLGDATGLNGIGFHLIAVAPGDETTELHVHHHEDECVYVLEGEGTALIGDEAVAIGPGDFIGYRKGGLAHSIRNTGEGVLRMLVAGERRDADVCDYPRAGKRLYRAPGMPWAVVDIDAITEVVAGAKK